jgi:hypothetical protein
MPFASIIKRFNVYGSVHRKYIPIYINKMQRYILYIEYFYDARIHER